MSGRSRFRLAFAPLLCLVLVLTGFACGPIDKRPPTRVLFIGNSYTYVNDLPGMLTALARAGGQKPLECGQEAPGGCTFEQHVKDGKAAKQIAAKKWHYVVLQEQSLRPLEDPDAMKKYGRTLDEWANRQGAQTLLYLTWCRENAPRTQERITDAYRELAEVSGADVVPVGLAWEAVMKADPKAGLYADDKSHPSPKGTYLAACVFYSVLYKKSPEGLSGSIAGLDDAEAKKLQQAAWKSVEDFHAAE